MGNPVLARRDDVFLRPGGEPLLADEAPYFGRGLLVQRRRMLRVHREDFKEGSVGRGKRPEQIVDDRVEHLGLGFGLLQFVTRPEAQPALAPLPRQEATTTAASTLSMSAASLGPSVPVA